MDSEAKHEKRVTLEKIKLAEVEELADANSENDVTLAHEKIVQSIKQLELSKDNTLNWSAKQKDSLAQFRLLRDRRQMN